MKKEDPAFHTVIRRHQDTSLTIGAFCLSCDDALCALTPTKRPPVPPQLEEFAMDPVSHASRHVLRDHRKKHRALGEVLNQGQHRLKA